MALQDSNTTTNKLCRSLSPHFSGHLSSFSFPLISLTLQERRISSSFLLSRPSFPPKLLFHPSSLPSVSFSTANCRLFQRHDLCISSLSGRLSSFFVAHRLFAFSLGTPRRAREYGGGKFSAFPRSFLRKRKCFAALRGSFVGKKNWRCAASEFHWLKYTVFLFEDELRFLISKSVAALSTRAYSLAFPRCNPYVAQSRLDFVCRIKPLYGNYAAK